MDHLPLWILLLGGLVLLAHIVSSSSPPEYTVEEAWIVLKEAHHVVLSKRRGMTSTDTMAKAYETIGRLLGLLQPLEEDAADRLQPDEPVAEEQYRVWLEELTTQMNALKSFRPLGVAVDVLTAQWRVELYMAKIAAVKKATAERSFQERITELEHKMTQFKRSLQKFARTWNTGESIDEEDYEQAKVDLETRLAELKAEVVQLSVDVSRSGSTRKRWPQNLGQWARNPRLYLPLTFLSTGSVAYIVFRYLNPAASIEPVAGFAAAANSTVLISSTLGVSSQPTPLALWLAIGFVAGLFITWAVVSNCGSNGTKAPRSRSETANEQQPQVNVIVVDDRRAKTKSKSKTKSSTHSSRKRLEGITFGKDKSVKKSKGNGETTSTGASTPSNSLAPLRWKSGREAFERSSRARFKATPDEAYHLLRVPTRSRSRSSEGREGGTRPVSPEPKVVSP